MVSCSFVAEGENSSILDYEGEYICQLKQWRLSVAVCVENTNFESIMFGRSVNDQ